MFPRLLTFAIVVGVLVFFIDREGRRGSLADWERGYLSWLAGNSKRLPAKANIVHLTLENPSDTGASGVFDQWPPGAIDYALLLENLALYSPRSVVVEPVLRWADEGSDLATSILAEKLTDLPALTLSCILQNDPTSPTEAPLLPQFPSANVTGTLDSVPEFTGTLLAPAPSLLSSPTTIVGFASIDLTTSTKSTNKIHLVAKNQGALVPSLALAAVINDAGIPADQVQVELGSHIQITPNIRIPIDHTGALTLPPTIDGQVTTVPADALFLDGDSREIVGLADENNPLEKIRGSLVILGFADSDNQLPSTLATVQAAHYPAELRADYQWGIWITLTVLGAVIVARPTKSLLPAFTVALLHTTAALLVFGTTTTWWPSAIPFSIITATLVLGQLLPPPKPSGTTTA